MTKIFRITTAAILVLVSNVLMSCGNDSQLQNMRSVQTGNSDNSTGGVVANQAGLNLWRSQFLLMEERLSNGTIQSFPPIKFDVQDRTSVEQRAIQLIQANPSRQLMFATCESSASRETCNEVPKKLNIYYIVVKTTGTHEFLMDFSRTHFSWAGALQDCKANAAIDRTLLRCTLGGETLAGRYLIRTNGTRGQFIGNLMLTKAEAENDCRSHCAESSICQWAQRPLLVECPAVSPPGMVTYR